MLNLIKSNKMENLVPPLCRILTQVPKDPMEKEWIGVPSRGMRQWLSQKIASTLGICAHVLFPFPRQIMEAVLAGEGKKVSKEDLLWSVMDLVWEAPDCPAPLKDYVRDDARGKKRLQLSARIAGVLDDYQVYRPDMVNHWSKTGTPLPGKEKAARDLESWQCFLWNQITRGRSHFAGQMDEFLGQEDAGRFKDLPGRICLFGISALPPSYLALLAKAARHLEIYLFLLTPCSQFFFDIPTPRQAGRLALAEADPLYTEIANPLLASLGRIGRDFHSCLEELDYHEPFGDLFEDPGSRPSLLSVLQSDILNLVARKPGGNVLPVPVRSKDRSLSVHACHSPMREAQVLKDLLLDAFDRDPGLAPHEIIVMMPDVEAYAPYIESVFSTLTDREGERIPFSLADRRKRIESALVQGFLQILDMNHSRMERRQVLELLRSAPVADRFNISGAEAAILESAVREAGILWGLDREHRQTLTGTRFEENTWMFGFDRLFLGYASAGETLMEGRAPALFFEGLDSDLLGRFAHFCETLFDFVRGLERLLSVSEWAGFFRDMALSMLASSPANEPDLSFLLQCIDAFAREAEEAGFQRQIGFDVARQILEGKLDQQTDQGGFLSGKITFCNLMPMRSIPFQVVALMGMGEAAFPRSGVEVGIDLMARYPRKGDKQTRDEDRYLFLEALVSARQSLIITYTGMDIKDNSPIPCSGVVSELMDAMDLSFEFPEGFQYRFEHPLHGFSPRYFNSTPGYFSFSRELCAIARSQTGRAGQTDPAAFLEAFGRTEVPADRKIRSVCLEELVRFFRNPAQTFVRQTLGLDLPIPGAPVPDRERFQVSGLERFILGTDILENGAGQGQGDSADTGVLDLYRLFRARGVLPLGQKGKTEFLDIVTQVRPVAGTARALIREDRIEPLAVDLTLLDIQVTGRIRDLFREGGKTIRCVSGFGRLTPARLISLWIHHLALNLSLGSGGDPVETRMVGRDPQGKKPVITGTIQPMGDRSRPVLETLIRFYLAGRENFFPFFCNTGFALVQALAEKSADPDGLGFALQKSRPFWFNAFAGTGEARDPYVRLCLGEKDPFENEKTLAESGILETAMAVVQPLLENLTLG